MLDEKALQRKLLPRISEGEKRYGSFDHAPRVCKRFGLRSGHPQKEAPSPPEVLTPATGFQKLL
jgi:hypothetical protein